VSISLLADDLDTIVLAEFFADRGLSQISLAVHEAYGRTSELAGHAHNRCRTVAGAVPKIGGDRRRTNQNEGRQHRRPSITAQAMAVPRSTAVVKIGS
jgi:hypothetical protein